MLVAGGSTNVTTYFAMRLAADGTAATGLTITGMDLQYVRSGVAPSAKVDATALAATDSAHGDNQAIEVDGTDQPGLYRVDWPDAAFAAGVREVILTVKVATAFTEHLRCEIDGEVNVVEWAGTDVVAGAIPAAAADAAGGLPISDAGALDLDTQLAATNEVTAARMGALTDWINGGRLDLILDIIAGDVVNLDGDAMRGTDNAALASVLGALADAAAAGDPTSADTVMQYVKQLINVLVGTAGIGTWPASAAPANAVSIAEALRAVYDDTNSLDGTKIPDTISLAAINAQVDTALTDIGLDHLLAAAVVGADVTDDSIFAMLASASATADWDDFVNTTESLQALRDRGDAAWITGAGGSDRLLMVDTTIATLATQTSFTLTAGSADDDAYNNCTIVVEDVSTATQKAVGMIIDYTGASKTVTLKEALAFTIATTDKVYILAENALKSTVANRQLDVSANGNAGIDWANVENPTTVLDLSATDIQLADTVTDVTNRVTANADQIAGVAAAATQLSLSADTVFDGTASGTPTTTTMVSDIGITDDDQFKGRVIIFADDTTTAGLRGQATDITACTAASNTLTFTALTQAPVSGDTFVIV